MAESAIEVAAMEAAKCLGYDDTLLDLQLQAVVGQLRALIIDEAHTVKVKLILISFI